MENELKMASVDCDCCRLPESEYEEEYGCAQRKAVFTVREQAVLRRIREAHERARALKERLRRFAAEGAPDERARTEAEKELTRLRELRAELELERIAAADERMRLLGHA